MPRIAVSDLEGMITQASDNVRRRIEVTEPNIFANGMSNHTSLSLRAPLYIFSSRKFDRQQFNLMRKKLRACLAVQIMHVKLVFNNSINSAMFCDCFLDTFTYHLDYFLNHQSIRSLNMRGCCHVSVFR